MEVFNDKLTSSPARLQVINFWASWCGPCIKELPAFEILSKNSEVDVTLVSVDFIQDIDKALRVLQKRGIKMDALLLNADNYIELIDKSWSGAIPATLILHPNGKRYFYEQAFSENELLDLVDNIL